MKDIINLPRYGRRMVSIALGGCLSALAVDIFFLPNQFLSGGLSGVAMILEYCLSIPTALTLLILNIPIFILGAIYLDLHYVVASLVGMLSYTFFIHLFTPLRGSLYIPDEILAALFGGALNGIGLGLMFKSRASVGGTDILGAIAKRRWSINLGTTLFVLNLIIVSTAALFFEVYKGMYSLVGMFVTSALIDKVVGGLERRFAVMIVSEKWETIAKEITESLYRGATLLDGEGAYRRRQLKIVYTVIPSLRLARLKDLVYNIDPEAFVSISSSSEIMGNWKLGFLHRYRRIYRKED